MFNILFIPDDPPTSSSATLRLQGTATLEFCDDLRTALLDAFDRVQSLAIDVSEITEMHVAALQLFCAARRSAIKRKKIMVLADNCSEAFCTAVLAAGFFRTHTAICQLEAGQACLWDACKPAATEVAP